MKVYDYKAPRGLPQHTHTFGFSKELFENLSFSSWSPGGLVY